MIDLYTCTKYLYGPNKGGNMFGSDEENKNKIEQLEEEVEALKNKIADIMEVLQMQDDVEDEDEDEDIEEEDKD
jgi:TolA-binding protein